MSLLPLVRLNLQNDWIRKRYFIKKQEDKKKRKEKRKSLVALYPFSLQPQSQTKTHPKYNIFNCLLSFLFFSFWNLLTIFRSPIFYLRKLKTDIKIWILFQLDPFRWYPRCGDFFFPLFQNKVLISFFRTSFSLYLSSCLLLPLFVFLSFPSSPFPGPLQRQRKTAG